MFNLASLQARIHAVRVAPSAPVVLSAHAIMRKDTARNPRSVRSIIEESGELDVHDFDMQDNTESLAVAI